VIVLQSVNQNVLQPLIQTLGQVSQHLQGGVAGPLGSLQAEAARTLDELSKRGCRDLFSKLVPGPDQIVSSAREAIETRLQEVFGAVAKFEEAGSADKIAKQKV
jgi:phage-related minor tail protein